MSAPALNGADFNGADLASTRLIEPIGLDAQEFRQGAEYRASAARMRSSSMAATQPMHTLPEARMRRVLLASIAFGLVAFSAAAQDRKGIRFWNLTLYTITTLQMSPAGKDSWGPD